MEAVDTTRDVDVAIVGAGPSGLFAAYYAGFRGLTTAVIDTLPEPGGQISAMYPEKAILDVAGFPTIKGRDLVANLVAQAAPFTPLYLLGVRAEELSFSAERPVLRLADGSDLGCGAVIITGGLGGFTPRPLAYFETMWDALRAEDEDRIRLYLAHHEGDLVAATIWVRVGGHTWYAYGASSTEKRDVRGSNAIQWAMIRDALAAGAHVYDLRGITDTLAEDDPHLGLIQFKVGTGGEAVEYAGEWDLPLNRAIYKAFDLYMARRG